MDTDVVVIGGGGAGLAAALSAAECGARVTLLEKCPQLGGTTSIAVGSFTAACTSLQRAAEIEDDPVWHNEDMGAFAAHRESRNNWELRGFFAQHAAETLAWLLEMGLEFHGPSPEPPNRVPRMYNVIPNAKAYVAALHRRLLQHGVDIRLSHRVTKLIRHADGAVTGVEADSPRGMVSIRAKQGVILAAGDYSNGETVKRLFLPQEVAEIEGINPNATGDGHTLAQEIGAALLNMDLVYGPEIRFIAPPRKPFAQLLPGNPTLARLLAKGMAILPKTMMNRFIKSLLVTWQHPENSLFAEGAVLVNRDGQRFCDETNNPEPAIARQPGKIAYIVIDQMLAEKFSKWPHFVSTAPDIAYAYVQDYKRLRPDVYAEADTLSLLAEKLHAEHLPAAIEFFNAAVRGTRADDRGRTTFGPPVKHPPFIALGPIKSWIVTTEGGVRINDRMEVLDEQARVIPHLYAAGSNGMGGMVLWGHGLHIAWAFTSGRLAGRHAATAK